MRESKRVFLSLWAALLCLCAACAKITEPTEVLVGVGSDLTVGQQLTRVDVEVYAGNGMGLMLHSASFPLAVPGAQGFSLPLSFSVVPSTQRDMRTFRVVVTGIGSLTAGAVPGPIVEKQVVAAFRPNTQIRVEVFLSQVCLGKLCRDGMGRRGDLTCNAAGECDIVPVKVDMPTGAVDASTMDAQLSSSDAGDANLPTDSRAAIDTSVVADGGDAAMSPGDAHTGGPETGPPPPTSECDATRACAAAGYVCVQEACVSKCTQTQCDPNATCSLMAGAAVCTCGSGFIEMKGGTGAVTCMRDITCEQLGCDPNAMCLLNTDQTRACVCKPGYTGNGKSCAPVDCGPVSLSNGTAPATNGITTYGGMVTYGCNLGYVRSGAATATCGVDAKWSATATCAPVDCGTPTLANGKAMLASGTTYGSSVNYSCNVGYNRSGAVMGTCGADRNWAPTASCTVVTCPTLVAPTRGSISTTDGSKYDSVASYSCTNSTLDGNPTRKCQANGFWSGDDASCLYCGDGKATESCDPTAPSWSLWTCTASCSRRTNYVPCSGNNGSQGIGCDPGQICFLGSCGLTPCVGDTSCPAAPTGPGVARCSANSICLMTQCASESDCAPGLTCRLDANPPYCTGCSSSAACAGGKSCTPYIGQSFGHCD